MCCESVIHIQLRVVDGKVCCCARLTNKSARSKASCPAAFWATAGQADPAQSFPSLCCSSKKSVMVYTNTTATASDMESHAEVAASSLEKAKTSSDPITVLQPFAHQVGGHTQLLVLDHSTLCKPLIQRELHFYLNVPREMRNFIPLYKGVVQVQQIDNSPTIYHPVRGSNKNYGDCEDKLNRTQRHKTSPELRVQIHSCSDKKLIKEKHLHQLYSRPNPKYFLLLENVASNFHKPCILDLKMGTRQHGDDAPPDKRSRQMAKCAASTSARLGVRLCGMQVYKADVDGYICKDKYYGRSLDENGMKSALFQFFCNGSYLRVSLLRKVIGRLIELKKAIEKQHTFRFYSSSLLILYEGCLKGRQEETEDFFSLLENENSCFEDMEKFGSESMMDDESSLESSNDSTSASASLSWLSSHKMSIESKKCNVVHGPEVDVRMIDFAHTTYEGYDGDTTVHSGPDTGYILGLDNMIRLLREVEDLNSSVDKI
ncbi:inositol hexakisphosphate kinase 2-like isoform X1 [Stegodyphus dumicola]|uniref:inositol hexakisphosphate kinase 2-like isoform X1 n=2 Tax=Stegodyphus dumicola TaxID=202533 RepID=UPI0015A9D630|nr:inositol hexakisphosphate kinase 2-like isoform X1 [Stegodyphus dumicola]